MSPTRTVCIYHGNCADGFTAAWVVRKWWSKQQHDVEDTIEYIAGVYQTPPPLEQVKDASVIIVDFSYSPEIMQAIISAAKHTLWLDHHKSAILAMDEAFMIDGNQGETTKFEYLTDLKRSGAGLAWDYFFPDKPRPWLVRYVEDRDLWTFAYDSTRPIQAYIFSFPYDFTLWDDFARDLEDPVKSDAIRLAGEAIERKHFKDINELLPICTRHIRIADVVIPCANLPYTMVSDAGHILAKRNPALFGICYYDGLTGRNFSLRSVEGGADVSEIAKQFGGGGHARAAGFRVSFEDAKQFEIG